MKFCQRLISVAAVVAVSIDAKSEPWSKRVTLGTATNFTGFCLHMDWPGTIGQPHDCLMFPAPCGASGGTSYFNFGSLDNLAASVECQW
ncbi:hypothetical protein B0H14DRAFT_2792983 [Mycena olivaceomarginata]|nr:hypothetical protein B0H14DRAFT_2792983 [Mycena olivaceomarginata]